jgi:hypothetical protein
VARAILEIFKDKLAMLLFSPLSFHGFPVTLPVQRPQRNRHVIQRFIQHPEFRSESGLRKRRKKGRKQGKDKKAEKKKAETPTTQKDST